MINSFVRLPTIPPPPQKELQTNRCCLQRFFYCYILFNVNYRNLITLFLYLWLLIKIPRKNKTLFPFTILKEVIKWIITFFIKTAHFLQSNTISQCKGVLKAYKFSRQLSSNNKQIKGYLVACLTINIKRGIVPLLGLVVKQKFKWKGERTFDVLIYSKGVW